MRDSVIIYRSFVEAIKSLPKELQADAWNAIFEFSLDFKEPETDGIVKTIFTLIKPQLEANNKRFANGKKAKQKQNRSKTEAKRSKRQSNSKQEISETEANVNVNVNVNPNVNVNENKEGGVVLKKVKKFVVSGNYFDDSEINSSFCDFLSERKLWGKPATELAVKKLVKKLNEISCGAKSVALAIIDKSITSRWTDLYPLKPENGQITQKEEKKYGRLTEEKFRQFDAENS